MIGQNNNRSCFFKILFLSFLCVGCFSNVALSFMVAAPIPSLLVRPQTSQSFPTTRGRKEIVQSISNKQQQKHHQHLKLFSSKLNDSEEDVKKHYDSEETLMRIHLSMVKHPQKDTDPVSSSLSKRPPSVAVIKTMKQIQKYTQSFPFAAILPVQPMTYLPTSDGGVEISFLRKKTKEKGSVDGGIRFFIQPHVEYVETGIDIVAKRNSRGQTISKMFSEKLLIQAYVQGITGQQEEGEYGGTPISEIVTVQSIYHKWM